MAPGFGEVLGCSRLVDVIAVLSGEEIVLSFDAVDNALLVIIEFILAVVSVFTEELVSLGRRLPEL